MSAKPSVRVYNVPYHIGTDLVGKVQHVMMSRRKLTFYLLKDDSGFRRVTEQEFLDEMNRLAAIASEEYQRGLDNE